MASKKQLEAWAAAQQIDTTGMSTKAIEQALDKASNPRPVFPAECQTNGQKFRWAVAQNLKAIGEVIRNA